MRPVDRKELTALIQSGEGVALVDRGASGGDRPSMLHSITCRWLKKTGAATPLRYAGRQREAIRWLQQVRGQEGDRWQRCTECRATDPRQAGLRASTPERDAGELVWVTDRGRELATVIGVSSEEVDVVAFDSPSHESVASRKVRIEDTSRFLPRGGDRCFVDVDGEWRAAECDESVSESSQQVSVRCGNEDLVVVPARVRVRSIGPLLDPLGELADGRSGRLEMLQARTEFQRRYLEFAAVDRGLHGVVSASVDLFPHQVGVARRVLADPVQRYLLADEVGLGKTIEAGFIIRQRLIDAPRSVIVVLVPGPLVWQWESELEDKFTLSELRSGGVEVISYDEERAFDRAIAPDLIVLDEAHRVAAGWGSDVPELAKRFEAARSLSHRVPRVLLLSATPVLHRERDLLAMLHLLDPDAYPLAGIDAFVTRVRDRERIGELLLALQPGVPDFLLNSRLPDLRETFGGDERMAGILDLVEQSDSADRELALADARAHVSETYRLHRRLLRNRRSSIEATTFAVRGRGPLNLADDGDVRRAAIDAWLERWRTTLLEEAHERDLPEEREKALRAFIVWASYATGDPAALRDLALFRLTLHTSRRLAAGLSAEERSAVKAFDRTPRQRAALEALLGILGDEESDETRGERITDQLTAVAGDAVVVFVSSPATITAVRERLHAAGLTASELTYAMSDAERRETVTRFTGDAGRRFLLCDAAGEEGLNLQVADRIVHADLPYSTTRIEQRIGRADRHGDGGPVPSTLIVPGPPDGFGAMWLSALRDAFGVFEGSTAPMQYAIETVERDLLRLLFTEGVDEATSELEGVRARVVEEQARIDKVDALDALARQETDDVQFVEQVRTVEQTVAGPFASAVMHSAEAHSKALGADVRPLAGGGRAFRFARRPPPTMLFPALDDRQVNTTANRRLAVTDASLSLLRPGAPLVELIRAQQDWDDRTQTAAVVSNDPGHEEALIAVRCDLVLQADTDQAFATWKALEDARPRTARAVRTDADAPLARAALQRRLDSYFAPRPVSLWFDRDLEPIEEAELIEEFEERLATPDAVAWPTTLWDEAARRLSVLSIADFLKPLAGRAVQTALCAPELSELTATAVARAEHDAAENERLLRLRSEISLEARPAQRDLKAERTMSAVLIESLRAPHAHWSGACMLWLGPLDAPTQ